MKADAEAGEEGKSRATSARGKLGLGHLQGEDIPHSNGPMTMHQVSEECSVVRILATAVA